MITVEAIGIENIRQVGSIEEVNMVAGNQDLVAGAEMIDVIAVDHQVVDHVIGEIIIEVSINHRYSANLVL